MALIVVLNVVLSLGVLLAIVGGHLWCIIRERDLSARARVHVPELDVHVPELELELGESAARLQPVQVEA
jgi:hypothetical protein